MSGTFCEFEAEVRRADEVLRGLPHSQPVPFGWPLQVLGEHARRHRQVRSRAVYEVSKDPNCTLKSIPVDDHLGCARCRPV
eukprot:IDg2718t1